PIANAGPDQLVDEGVTVMLNGTGSSDPDGDPITLAWSQTAGPAVTLTSISATQPTFTAPDVSTDTVLTFQLIVADGITNSVPDEVRITVRAKPDSGSTNKDGSGGGCFIATAAFGTPMAQEVQILCAFRDQYLLTNWLGQAFIALYYRYSPPL